MVQDIPQLEALLRVLVAALLGAVIGFDRQRKEKAAGVRTHMLVAIGATLFMSVAALLQGDYGSMDSSTSILRIDPTRVVQGIVTGVGFIGAGQIFQNREAVHGLTSAAGIWVTASIGVLVGLGHFIVPGVATLLVFLVMAGLEPLEARFGRGSDEDEPSEADD